jgi:hypothetical protein
MSPPASASATLSYGLVARIVTGALTGLGALLGAWLLFRRLRP